MRRLIIPISVIVLAGGICVTAVSIRSKRSHRPISLCDIARNPAKYDKQTVHVKASGWVTSSDIYRDFSIYDMSCGTSDAGAGVELDQSYSPAAEVSELLNSPKQEIRKAEVVVIGKFDQWATLGCCR